MDEFGADSVFNGNVTDSDDIVGTCGSLLHSLSASANGTLGNADGVVSDEALTGNLIATMNAVRTGHTFLNDIAHAALPTDDLGNPPLADTDSVVGRFKADGTPTDPAKFYDSEVTQDTFQLRGNLTLVAADYTFA